MSRRWTLILAVALALSVGVNLFAGAAALTALSRQNEIASNVGDKRGWRGRASMREVIDSLSPASRERVREAMERAAERARPDFQEAREARRQAIAAAVAEPLDAGVVKALLDRSRAAELRGREKVEADALLILATLDASDRRAFSNLLKGRGGGGRGDRREVDLRSQPQN